MKALITSAFLLMLIALNTSHAQSLGYEELAKPITPSGDSNTVEVTEIFWFGCPHCFAFEPSINSWNKNKAEGVSFAREAPPLNRSWLPQSQAFYAAEIMDVTDVIMQPLFAAIHNGKRRLRKPEQLVEFVGELGVDTELFERTMKSFAVDVRIKRSLRMAQDAGITGVPTVIIDGKYRTSPTITGSHDRTIDVIEALSEQQLRARAIQ